MSQEKPEPDDLEELRKRVREIIEEDRDLLDELA